MVGFVRWLKSIVVSPRHLTALSSALDFAGPQISGGYRRLLFRLFGAMVGVSLTGTRLEAILSGIFGLVYRLRPSGLENLPNRGVLLVANHSSHFDALFLQLACPRPIRFVTFEYVCGNPWTSTVLKFLGAETVPISKIHLRQAIRESVEHIRTGGILCIFPEGLISHTENLLEMREGFELIARVAECEVVPVWLDGLYDSIFSVKDGRYTFKFPKRIYSPVNVLFGKPIPAELAEKEWVRRKLLELSESLRRSSPARAGGQKFRSLSGT
jgi:acyl-[acyl-carrier-protein]-phospholipid O-acyltransferase/long-chain-fatty-acid--[acyl-carrier-protein] ligase